jgi:hypothetical protein
MGYRVPAAPMGIAGSGIQRDLSFQITSIGRTKTDGER